MFSDPILTSLIAKYSQPTFADRTNYLFEDLIESIISQQLSVKASDTIYKRFKELFVDQGVAGGNQHPRGEDATKRNINTSGVSQEQHDLNVSKQFFPTPQQILDMPNETIRTAGISFQKISYIKSVADAFISGLIDTKKIKKMTDEEVIACLTQIRGVGKWTAEMILVFTLKRPDVFSLGDLGIRNAIKNLYGITDQKKILKLSEKWKPYRSTACWYLWRSLENR